MIDCPHHGPVDGLFCVKCLPTTPRNRPIPAAAKANIDAIRDRLRKPVDREAEEERAAIRGEGW